MDLGNVRPFLKLDLVHKDGPHIAGVIMVERIGKLVGDVGVESPTERNASR
jgi:hypothetical protein